jgi:hypothetical protein
MVAGDAVLESNVANSSLRDRPYNEHDTDSVKADDLQGAGQTAPVINTPVFDEAPLSTADIGEDDPVMIDISCFTTAKILDKRSSPFGVEYRCELGPVWLSSVLVKTLHHLHPHAFIIQRIAPITNGAAIRSQRHVSRLSKDA